MQSSSEPKSLKQKLIEITDKYIADKTKKEKEKKEKLKQSVQTNNFGFLKKGWEQTKAAIRPDGVKRAEKYLDKVIGIEVASDNDKLMNMILDDLEAGKLKSKFGTSKVYRNKILEGVFDHLGIPFERIQQEKMLKAKEHSLLMRSWTSGPSHAVPPALDAGTKTIAAELIMEKLNARRPNLFIRAPGSQKEASADQEALKKHKQPKMKPRWTPDDEL